MTETRPTCTDRLLDESLEEVEALTVGAGVDSASSSDDRSLRSQARAARVAVFRRHVGPNRSTDIDRDDQAELAAVLLQFAGRFRDLSSAEGRADIRLAMEQR